MWIEIGFRNVGVVRFIFRVIFIGKGLQGESSDVELFDIEFVDEIVFSLGELIDFCGEILGKFLGLLLMLIFKILDKGRITYIFY